MLVSSSLDSVLYQASTVLLERDRRENVSGKYQRAGGLRFEVLMMVALILVKR